MKKIFLLFGLSCFTSVVSAQTRVGSGVDISPLQLDLVAPGIDLRSTDNLNVIQRIEDSSGKTWYIRQQGALFALYPRGVEPNELGQDVIPPGTRWFIGLQNLQQALGISTDMRPSGLAIDPGAAGLSSTGSAALWPLGSRSDTPNADRWLQDKSYRRRAVRRWLRRGALTLTFVGGRYVAPGQYHKTQCESKPERSWPTLTMQ